MKQIYIFIALLFSLRISAMEKAPKQGEVFPLLLALPAELQNHIGSYLAEDDRALHEKFPSNKKSVSLNDIVEFLQEYQKVAPEKNSSRKRPRCVASQDGTKFLICAYNYSKQKKTLCTYDTVTKTVDEKIVNRSDGLSRRSSLIPFAISNDGKTFVIYDYYSLHAGCGMRIMQNGISYYINLRGATSDVRINKPATKIAFRSQTYSAENGYINRTLIYSRRFPQQDLNYPENLLGRYFREIGVCKTLSKQNPNLR